MHFPSFYNSLSVLFSSLLVSPDCLCQRWTGCCLTAPVSIVLISQVSLSSQRSRATPSSPAHRLSEHAFYHPVLFIPLNVAAALRDSTHSLNSCWRNGVEIFSSLSCTLRFRIHSLFCAIGALVWAETCRSECVWWLVGYEKRFLIRLRAFSVLRHLCYWVGGWVAW